MAAASSDKDLDKDVLCLHYCLTFISSMSSTKHWRLQEGVKVGGVLIPAMRFAEDQAMVSHTVRVFLLLDGSA